MRDYYLFLVKESVAIEFTGKEHKIYSLFLDSFQNEIAKKQTAYITQHIPTIVDNIITNALSDNESYTFHKHIHRLNMEDGQANLQISEDFVFLQSKGKNQIETYFFEILRKWKKNFFAIEKNHGIYGWLTPINRVSEVKNLM